VLVVDRLEELFTRCKHEADRRAFVVNLRTLIREGGGHRVILVLRSDIEKQLAQLDADFAKLLEKARYLMPPPDAKDLREAILRPADRVGLKFEERLVEQIASDLVGHPGALPFLQFLLRRLWEKREGNRITWGAYNALGRRQVVDRCAEAVYASFSNEEKDTARRLLLRLVQPGLGDRELVTASAPRGELTPPGEDPDRVRRVLEQLVGAGLLRIRPGGAPGVERVEVVHEALVAQWRRLLDWVEQERAATGQRALLAKAVQQWHKLGRDPKALWRGHLLQEALGFRDLSPLETEFLWTSQGVEAREERRKRRVAYLLAAAAVVIAVLLGLNLWGAIRALVREKDLNRQVTSQKLAAQSVLLQDDQLDLGLLLSLAAIEGKKDTATIEDKKVTAEARISLIRGVNRNPGLQAFLHDHQADVFAVAYSPDGELLASASADGVIAVWDMNHIAHPLHSLRGDQAIVRCLAFARRDGQRLLASGGTDGLVLLWDAATGKQVGEFPALPGAVPKDPARRVVRSIAFSPDGTRLAAGSWDGKLCVYDVAARKVLHELAGHAASVNCVAFSHDGQVLASGGADTFVRLWDSASGRPLDAKYKHGDVINGVAFSRDSRWLAAGAADGTVLLWDWDVGRRRWKNTRPSPLPRGPAHRRGGFISSLAFSPDSDTLAAGTGGREVLLWNVQDRSLEKSLTGHRDVVWSVAFRTGTGGKELASAGGENKVILWNVQEETPLARDVPWHTDAVSALAFDPKGQWLASGSPDNQVIFWSVRTRQPAGHPLAQTKEVRGLAYSPDGNLLACAGSGSQGNIRLWDIQDPENPRERGILPGHGGDVTGVAFSPDGRWLASCGVDGFLRVWDATTLKRIGEQASQPPAQLLSLAVAGNARGALVATAAEDESIRLWACDVAGAPTAVATLKPAGAPLSAPQVRCVALSADGRWLACGGNDGALHLWDLSAAKPSPVTVAGKHEDVVRSLAFSADGKLLASGSYDHTVGLWEVATRGGGRFSGHQDKVLAVTFAGTKPLLASADQDGVVRLWDVAGPPHPRLKENGGTVGTDQALSVAFGSGPTRPLLVSGHPNGTIQMWDADRGKPTGRAERAHNGRVWSLALSPDGSTLASGGTDGRIALWDVSNRKDLRPIRPPLAEDSPIFGLAFGPDGMLAASCLNNTVSLWSATTGDHLGHLTAGQDTPAGALRQRAKLWDVSATNQREYDTWFRYRDWGGPVAFRAGGAVLATSGADNTIVLWDVRTRQPIGGPLTGHTDRVWSLAFSPDGKLLASGDGDGGIRLWDVKDPSHARPLSGSLIGHAGTVRVVAFSPDGLLASGGADGKILLWDFGSLHSIELPLAGRSHEILSLSFSSDGKLASGGKDGAIQVWDVSLESIKKRARRIANRELTDLEREKYLPKGQD
jgi:WD40 repeat protein